MPAFPTPENQSFDTWLHVAKDALQSTDPDQTVLVGHSMGCGFALRLAELTAKPYRAIMSAAPFVEMIGNPFFDTRNATFIEHTFDWPKIKNGAKDFVFYAGDNDPYVPLAMSRRVTDPLGVELQIVPGGGHLNAEFGMKSFDKLLQTIENMLL